MADDRADRTPPVWRPDRDDARPASPSPPCMTVSSKSLFPDGDREIRINHEGTEYRLRITKQNKLILYR